MAYESAIILEEIYTCQFLIIADEYTNFAPSLFLSRGIGILTAEAVTEEAVFREFHVLNHIRILCWSLRLNPRLLFNKYAIPALINPLNLFTSHASCFGQYASFS